MNGKIVGTQPRRWHAFHCWARGQGSDRQTQCLSRAETFQRHQQNVQFSIWVITVNLWILPWHTSVPLLSCTLRGSLVTSRLTCSFKVSSLTATVSFPVVCFSPELIFLADNTHKRINVFCRIVFTSFIFNKLTLHLLIPLQPLTFIVHLFSFLYPPPSHPRCSCCAI